MTGNFIQLKINAKQRLEPIRKEVTYENIMFMEV